eukprot:CAMPEP_0184323696 /NCGR_PEP_ID=MMETSP1049-20130417/131650_1 /TAXON_ID=77928 /ORGANISM="Proteomonas sulcata, Strain CCMP704" /LENGTH=297 /DNA_ID=CAMNT_0026645265 /DNA_START=191 /DNA_END=1084 /DNA_ORIENTATION=-
MACLDPTVHLPHKVDDPEHQEVYDLRSNGIKQQILDALEDPEAKVEISRWIPGFVDGELIQEDPSSPGSLHKTSSKAKLEALGEQAVCEANESLSGHGKPIAIAEANGPSVRMIYAHADLELRRRYAIEFRETAGHVQFKRIASMGSTAPSKMSLEKRAKMSVSNSKFQSSQNSKMFHRDPKHALHQLRRTGSAKADFGSIGLAQRYSEEIETARKRWESPDQDEKDPQRTQSSGMSARHSIEMATGASKRYNLKSNAETRDSHDSDFFNPIYVEPAPPVMNGISEHENGIKFTQDI